MSEEREPLAVGTTGNMELDDVAFNGFLFNVSLSIITAAIVTFCGGDGIITFLISLCAYFPLTCILMFLLIWKISKRGM